MSVALVTGASSGIGRATAVRLAEAGYTVHAVGRRAEALHDLAAEVPGVIPVVADLATLEFARIMPEDVAVLVHAAAVGDAYRVDVATPRDWLEQLTTNVVAAAELARLALPSLRARRGHVVLVNSGAGLRSFAGHTVYSASKHALRALADGLRLEEDSAGVRVTTVYPGPTDTPLFHSSVGGRPAAVDAAALLRPESVAEAIAAAVSAPADAQFTEIHVRPRVEINR